MSPGERGATSAGNTVRLPSGCRLGRYPPCPTIDRFPNQRLRGVVVRMCGPMCRRLFRLRVEGTEHLPPAGAAIIAANHLSFFDSVVLALAVPRPAAVRGQGRVPRPLDDAAPAARPRHDPGRARQPPPGLRRAAGRRPRCWRPTSCSPSTPRAPAPQDGSLQEGHNGVGHLSVTTGASVIPAGIVGTDRIQPQGRPGAAAVPAGDGAVRLADRSASLRRQPARVPPAHHDAT